MFSSLIIEYLRGVIACSTEKNSKSLPQEKAQFKSQHATETTSITAPLGIKKAAGKEEEVSVAAVVGAGPTASEHLRARGRETMKAALERLRRGGPWTLEARAPASAAAAVAATASTDADVDTKAMVESCRMPGRSGKIFRLTATLPGCTPACVWTMLRADSAKSSWLLAEAHTLQELEDGPSGSTDVQLQVSAPRLRGLVSRREFLLVRHWRALPGGSFALAVASTEHPAAAEQSWRVPRALCGPCGWLVEPSPDGAGTRLRWVVDCAMGGWLPASAADAASASYMLAYVAHLHARCRQRATPV